MTNLQYISDKSGHTTEVLLRIPIKQWELLKKKYIELEDEVSAAIGDNRKAVVANAFENPFFEELKKMDTDENWFPALNLLNDYYDDLMDEKQYVACNQEIERFLSGNYSLRLHLGLLTITNRRKKHLTVRPRLYQATKELASKTLNPSQVLTALRNLE